MSYYLVNGVSEYRTNNAAFFIKDSLEELGQRVTVLSDIQPIMKLMKNSVATPSERYSAILNFREDFVRDVVIPTMGEGQIVLYTGGLLLDPHWVDEKSISFEDMLRTNLEFLQVLGGIAYPRGVVLAQAHDDDPEVMRPFKERAYKLANSCSRFSQLYLNDDTVIEADFFTKS